MDAPVVPQITRQELLRRLHDPSLTIVNVLPRVAFEEAHIPRSISLPAADIPQLAGTLLPDKTADIALYCASHTCHAAAKAVGVLNELGYRRVRDFDGGMAEWTEAGLPVERGSRKVTPAAAPAPLKRPVEAASYRFAPARWSIRQLLVTWLGINLTFGVLYWLISFLPGQGLVEMGKTLGHGPGDLLEAIYFSFVTGLSIGFGDVVPIGVLRLLAVLEGAACLLVFGAIISKLVSGRQEEMTEEIHRIAFEDRLGRVRTNLHLVVREIQEIAELCGDGREPSDGMLARMESAAAVFSGELRAIHDLLYRPQMTPGEDVLESILAHLDGGLREFSNLLTCLRPDQRSSAALMTNVRSMAGLAEEICGECVPREYAPALRVWMDRVQSRAGGLAVVRS